MKSLLVLASLLTLAPAPPSVPPRQEEAIDAKARDQALVNAFKYLDKKLWQLNENGSPQLQYSVAMAGWAYMLASDRSQKAKKLPSRSREIKRIFDYLQRYVQKIEKEYANSAKAKKKPKRVRPAGAGLGLAFGKPSQYVWPLSVAAHFFAEHLARGKRKGECQRALRSIARILADAQQDNGGWGHDDARRPNLGLPKIPIPKPGGGGNLVYPGTLLSATGCALSGLGVASVGRKRKTYAKPLANGRRHLQKAQNSSGTFPYDTSQRMARQPRGGGRGGMSVIDRIDTARTSSAVLAYLLAGGRPTDDVVKNGIAAIDKGFKELGEGHGSATLALQYGALLSKVRGAEVWKRFRDEYFPTILERQEKSGAFLCAARSNAFGVTNDTEPLPGGISPPGFVDQGKTYVTAIHCLILALDRAPAKSLPEVPGLASVGGGVTPGKRQK